MRLNLDVHAVAFTLALLSLCLHSLPVDAAGAFAAHVTSLDGKAFASGVGGAMHTLRNNDRLYEKERVMTGRKTSVDIKFTDGTALSLGSSTIVTVDSYAYRTSSTSQQSSEKEETLSISIPQGAVRAVTGLLAKRRPLSVRFKA
ncbi:MAG: hypothetical protein VCB59_07110, partial [Gammaproteobacteria bacterium]